MSDDRKNLIVGELPQETVDALRANGHAPRATERRCQKCGTPTQGEKAWIDGQIWCHPCADAVSVSSTYVHDAPAGPSGSQVISESFGSGTPLVSGKKPTSAECGSRPDGATAHSSTSRETL